MSRKTSFTQGRTEYDRTNLIKQVLSMFLLSGVGYTLFKTKKLTLENNKALGTLLIYLSLPCVIIKGFLIERTPEHMTGLLISAVAAAVILALSIFISRLFFKKDAIAGFATAFSNPGFYGIPLIVVCLGNGAVFYVASFISFLNLLQWTYGVSIMTGQKPLQSLSLKKVLTAPFMIATLIGLVLFFSGITLPSFITDSITAIAGLDTPLAMFTTGVYLAQTDLLKMFKRLSLYKVSALRLVVIPLAALAILSLLPVKLYYMKLALLLCAACPVGSNVAVYAQLHNQDYSHYP